MPLPSPDPALVPRRLAVRDERLYADPRPIMLRIEAGQCPGSGPLIEPPRTVDLAARAVELHRLPSTPAPGGSGSSPVAPRAIRRLAVLAVDRRLIYHARLAVPPALAPAAPAAAAAVLRAAVLRFAELSGLQEFIGYVVPHFSRDGRPLHAHLLVSRAHPVANTLWGGAVWGEEILDPHHARPFR